jgi:AraC-like DNA-binding protein
MTLYIKYMVNRHCKIAVKEELTKLGLHFVFVNMTIVDIMENITNDQHEQLRNDLARSGLELMDDKDAVLIEKINNLIIEMAYRTDEWPKSDFSEYLSKFFNCDYTYMANLFSEGRGITIEEYITYHKIGRVKQLMIYNELSLKEIAGKMDFNSVSHLSKQFKRITGLTTSHFKKVKGTRQVLIENV